MYPSNKGQVSQRHEKVGLAGQLTTSNRPLLLCPSVKLMLKSVDVDLRDISVIGAEDQGFIRGESDVTQPGSPANHERSNDIGRGSESHALTRVEGLSHKPSWRDESHSWDGLKPVDALDPDGRTIDSLYDSYMPHIQLMHPFLEKPGLRPLFDQSIKN
ncbi:hypothetical protein D0864_04332 [Hortaea werneckii]|uniref:Uncharacterized protein n=1 Tax=Hortaea werneckii TaxID=91943 RepID=A0A3M7GBX8_HORWE|nr:hypothetical protein D0864_04332 [Hortaea werneckii]